MRQAQCVEFLQWCLPRLRMRWPGFRKVRSQVCKRIGRRMGELGLGGYDHYRHYLEEHDDEWERLDTMCRVTISRFWRDRGVFAALMAQVLPVLAGDAQERGELRCWSCGCASGEEVYSLAVAWHLGVAARFLGLQLEIVATDADPHMLERARAGVYAPRTVRELPAEWKPLALEPAGARHRVREEFRRGLIWLHHDVREQVPEGPFDLVLCRNLVFTYFDEELQAALLGRIAGVNLPGGALVVGKHEKLPGGNQLFEPWLEKHSVYRRL